MRTNDETGKTFGRLTVLRHVPNAFCLCLCSCGQERTVSARSLRNGHTKSCGCLRKEIMTSHGHTKTREYGTWADMKNRCHNPKHKGFKGYGGRGIKVCDRWFDSFENFLEDMGPRPKGHSLDRKDNDGNYCPENCHWATRRQQAGNKRTSRLIEYRGRTQCLADWAFELGMRKNCLSYRLDAGWSVSRAFTAPVGKRKSPSPPMNSVRETATHDAMSANDERGVISKDKSNAPGDR